MKTSQVSIALLLLAIVQLCGAGWGQPTTPAQPQPCGLGQIPLPVELNQTVTAQLGQVAWQASVEGKKGGTWAHTCGGVVISKQAVLTSASCVDGSNAGMVRTESGIVDLPKGGFVRRRRFTFPGAQKPGLAYTEAVKKHPEYGKTTLEHNLAVIRLATPFDFAKSEGNISSVCLPDDPSANSRPDTTLYVAGWGAQVGPNPALRPQMQLAPVRLVQCKVSVTANEFCAAQSSPLLQCEGDLGGPLFSDNSHGGARLVGIASRGSGCSEEDPLVYTRVDPYLDWILEASKPNY